ncbi:MAG: sigma-70 family RNA polymerase sigma factor [Verrucomicrobiota bacterium]
MSEKTIVVLAANPVDTSRLRLEEEVREIEEALRRAPHRGKFKAVCRWAVRSEDLRRAFLDHPPNLVHIAGHGAGDNGLVIEDRNGHAKSVSTQALAGLFELENSIECVLLNACYSSVQAKAISQHIEYVIGTTAAITDEAAIVFSTGFYDAIGAGKSYNKAYQWACNAIELEGLELSDPPLIYENGQDITSSRFYIVLEATMDEMNRGRAESIIESLAEEYEDVTFALEDIRPGSIVLVVRSTRTTEEALRNAFENDQLSELDGIRIRGIVTSLAEVPQLKKEADVIFREKETAPNRPEERSPSEKKTNFPSTHWSKVFAARGVDSAVAADARSALCNNYWGPLYILARRSGRSEQDAKDLTQGFFEARLEKDFLDGADPDKGRLRTYLYNLFIRYMANEYHKENSRKRGGGVPKLSLDVNWAEEQYVPEPADPLTPDQLFDRQWVQSLLDRALLKLCDRCRTDRDQTILRTLLPYVARNKNEPPYAEIGTKLDLSPEAVATRVSRLRSDLKILLKSYIRLTVDSEEQVEDELRYLLSLFSR